MYDPAKHLQSTFFEKIHNGLDTKHTSEFRLKSVNVKTFEAQPKF